MKYISRSSERIPNHKVSVDPGWLRPRSRRRSPDTVRGRRNHDELLLFHASIPNELDSRYEWSIVSAQGLDALREERASFFGILAPDLLKKVGMRRLEEYSDAITGAAIGSDDLHSDVRSYHAGASGATEHETALRMDAQPIPPSFAEFAPQRFRVPTELDIAIDGFHGTTLQANAIVEKLATIVAPQENPSEDQFAAAHLIARKGTSDDEATRLCNEIAAIGNSLQECVDGVLEVSASKTD